MIYFAVRLCNQGLLLGIMHVTASRRSELSRVPVVQAVTCLPSKHCAAYKRGDWHDSVAVLQVEYVKGWGKFAGANELEVTLLDGGTTTVNAKNFIVATGSEVSPLPGMKIDEERCARLHAPSRALAWGLSCAEAYSHLTSHVKVQQSLCQALQLQV